jgi:hypothetical protein
MLLYASWDDCNWLQVGVDSRFIWCILISKSQDPWSVYILPAIYRSMALQTKACQRPYKSLNLVDYCYCFIGMPDPSLGSMPRYHSWTPDQQLDCNAYISLQTNAARPATRLYAYINAKPAIRLLCLHIATWTIKNSQLLIKKSNCIQLY